MTEFEENQDRFLTQLLVIIFIIGAIIWFIDSTKWERKIMAIHYCFEELADGSLYHYVCEK